MFVLITRAHPADQWVPYHGGPWPTGGDASAEAVRLNTTASSRGILRRWKVQRQTSDDWKAREQARFANGEYEPTPWHNEPWYQAMHLEHFAHLSKTTPGRVAFTASPAKGMEDVQTRLGPGRYLTRYFGGHVSPGQLRSYCAAMGITAGDSELKVADETDEIVRVYREGPESCMSHSANNYETNGIHPAKVYGGQSDISVAYLVRHGDITARALIWEEKKRHNRLYGDCERLGFLLGEAGYQRGPFDGARLNKIECGSGLVLPYLDSEDSVDGSPEAAYADDHGSYLVFREHSGDYFADDTEGVAGGGWTCPNCGDRGDQEYSSWIDSEDQSVCSGCFDASYTHCDECQTNVRDSETTEVNGTTVCDSCAQEAIECGVCCGSYWERDIAGQTVDDESICSSCASQSDQAECGKYIPEGRDDCDCNECTEAVAA
jgi:hypothetical protein